jgi:hypothetical protein
VHHGLLRQARLRGRLQLTIAPGDRLHERFEQAARSGVSGQVKIGTSGNTTIEEASDRAEHVTELI